MSLRENERRILAEIEDALSKDDPGLDGHLRSFGGDDPHFGEDRPGRGLLWLLVGVATLVLCAMLAGLYFSAPVQGTGPATPPSAPGGAGDPQPGSGGG